MLISEHADFQQIQESLRMVWSHLTANAGKRGQGQLTGSVALAMNAADRLSRKPVDNVEALNASLSDAADALDQVVQWMNDHALPILGDDCDGGNSLSAGLEMKAGEIRDLLKAGEQ